MKIKKLIASLLAAVLMMGNLSAVCFAADSAPVPTSGATVTEAAGSGDAAEPTAPALPEGFTLGTEIILPDGVTIGEDGKITFSAQGLEQIMGALMGIDTSGDTDTGIDTGPETETVTDSAVFYHLHLEIQTKKLKYCAFRGLKSRYSWYTISKLNKNFQL